MNDGNNSWVRGKDVERTSLKPSGLHEVRTGRDRKRRLHHVLTVTVTFTVTVTVTVT